VNGVRYYYEILGTGPPLLMLHGGLGDQRMLAPVVPMFAENHQVVTIDMQGHGRTALGDRHLQRTAMADDVAELLTRLGIPQADVWGYSFGGWIALRLAIQHPERVRRLALVSTLYALDGWFPEIADQQAQLGAGAAPVMKNSPLYHAYVAVAPDTEAFPRLLDEVGTLLREPFDWSDDVRKLRGPVMLVYGDGDMIRPEHIVNFYHLLGGGLKDAGWQREHMPANRLAILPDVTHYETFASPAMAAAVIPFLESAASPSDQEGKP
jgi:pimeloyl-ACP methyl ester carboxylesterase